MKEGAYPNDKKIDGSSALIVVDVQNDFCPGGNLAVPEGDAVVPVINALTPKFTNVIATKDWHPAKHISFASAHAGRKVFDIISLGTFRQMLWPDHCVAGSRGAEFHKDIDTRPFRLILHKGIHPDVDSYSAFQDNDKRHKTGLEGYLKEIGVKKVFVCGLATDYCVKFTAIDASDAGFVTAVIIDACRGVDKKTTDAALEEMKVKGISILSSKELLIYG